MAGRRDAGGEDWDDGDDGVGRTPNDDRSDSMNPNSDEYQASLDNRSDYMHPNNAAFTLPVGDARTVEQPTS